MALEVKITRDPGGASELIRLLKCEDVSIGLARNITLIKLPGDTNLSLDLGISEWTIDVSGVADNTWVNTATGGIANVADLADIRDWGTSYTVRLTLYSSTVYADGKIRNLEMRREAGTDRWNWNLVFAVELLTMP
jgi:hypothetical protein